MTPLAEQIKKANDAKSKLKPRNAWGINVFLKKFTGTNRVAIREFAATKPDGVAMWIKICTVGLVDENGDNVFTDDDATSVLMEKDTEELEQIANEILEYNALGKTAQESAEKNLKIMSDEPGIVSHAS